MDTGTGTETVCVNRPLVKWNRFHVSPVGTLLLRVYHTERKRNGLKFGCFGMLCSHFASMTISPSKLVTLHQQWHIWKCREWVQTHCYWHKVKFWWWRKRIRQVWTGIYRKCTIGNTKRNTETRHSHSRWVSVNRPMRSSDVGFVDLLFSLISL